MSDTATPNIKVSNSTYDFLNALVRYFMPGLGTMYFALSQIWGLRYAEEVMGTIVAVTTFFGLIIGFARRGWKEEDELIIDKRDPEEMSFGFASGTHIEDLKDNQVLTLKVKTVEDPDRGSF